MNYNCFFLIFQLLVKFMIKTKIICTLGPALNSVSKILGIIKAGMNVARVNFSHGTYEEHAKTIQMVKEARKQANASVAILLDTKGPEIRIGIIKDNEILLEEGSEIKLINKESSDKKDELPIIPFTALNDMKIGMKILFDDGYIISHVTKIEKDCVYVIINNTGIIKSKKGVNIPDAELKDLPAITEKDKEDIKFGCKNGIDLIAASFIRTANNVLSLKQFLREEGYFNIPVISKIECKEGVENFDGIVQVSDGIMIARGDLGVEMDLSMIPFLQKMMIKKSLEHCKQVATATQMLESMIINPRPTRAEVSDVGNAIYDGSSLVMLSAETAVGKYPIKAVSQMKSIIEDAEKHFNYKDFLKHQKENCAGEGISSTVAIAAVESLYSSKAKAIFVITSSGFTANHISKLRPAFPIVALALDKKIFYQLSYMWGVVPIYCPQCKDADEAFEMMSKFAMEEKIVSFSDKVIFTAGVPFGRKGSTNMMRVESIGNIILRGSSKSYGKKIEGEILIIVSPEEIAPKDVKDKIIVISYWYEGYKNHIKESRGVILQTTKWDSFIEKNAIDVSKKFNKPIIIEAENAMSLLTDGQRVIIDPEKAIVYTKDF